MPQQPKNFITLSRSALYELVWTRPVTELANEFGISDVALAKRCRALKIPVPPRGHWAKVAAGQTPKRPRPCRLTRRTPPVRIPSSRSRPHRHRPNPPHHPHLRKPRSAHASTHSTSHRSTRCSTHTPPCCAPPSNCST